MGIHTMFRFCLGAKAKISIANDIRIRTDTLCHGNEENWKWKMPILRIVCVVYPLLQMKHINVAVLIGDHEKMRNGKKWKKANRCQVHFIKAYTIHMKSVRHKWSSFYDHFGFLFKANFTSSNQTFHLFQPDDANGIRIFSHTERIDHKFISIHRNLFRRKWKSRSKWPNKPNDTNIFPVK